MLQQGWAKCWQQVSRLRAEQNGAPAGPAAPACRRQWRACAWQQPEQQLGALLDPKNHGASRLYVMQRDMRLPMQKANPNKSAVHVQWLMRSAPGAHRSRCAAQRVMRIAAAVHGSRCAAQRVCMAAGHVHRSKCASQQAARQQTKYSPQDVFVVELPRKAEAEQVDVAGQRVVSVGEQAGAGHVWTGLKKRPHQLVAQGRDADLRHTRAWQHCEEG